MAQKERVTISKTKREWKLIDKRIKELGSKDYYRYLHKKIEAFLNDYDKFPIEIKKMLIIKRTKRQKCVPPNTYDRLSKMSKDINLPVSTIIDRIIITPLLIEK